MPKRSLIELTGEIKIDRPLSILFNDGTKEVWLPKSLIEINDDGTITVPVSIAQDKGLS